MHEQVFSLLFFPNITATVQYALFVCKLFKYLSFMFPKKAGYNRYTSIRRRVENGIVVVTFIRHPGVVQIY